MIVKMLLQLVTIRIFLCIFLLLFLIFLAFFDLFTYFLVLVLQLNDIEAQQVDLLCIIKQLLKLLRIVHVQLA